MCFVLLVVREEAKYDFYLFPSMYNKTIIRFGFYDIQNNQGRGRGYKPQFSASTDSPYQDWTSQKPHPIIVY